MVCRSLNTWRIDVLQEVNLLNFLPDQVNGVKEIKTKK